MDEEYQAVFARLLQIRGFAEFMQTFSPVNNGEKPILQMINGFKEYRQNHSPLNQSEIWLLDMLQNKMFELCYRHNSNTLFYLDDSQTIGDEILNEFRKDWETSDTGRKAFVESDSKIYKTIKDSTIYEEHSDDGIIAKYDNANHPLIYSTIGRSLLNGGYFTVGFPFISKGFNYANEADCIYWHSPYGVFGCVECIWVFIRLLSIRTIENKYPEYYKPLMKLLLVFLSRAIALCHIKKLPQAIDFYKNRAFLLKNHYHIFMAIFMDYGFIATNMEVQFVSDNYLGYKFASELGEPLLGAEMLNDSKKMYSYGSLNYFNEDNGLKIIEDASWLELVERGRIRVNKVAEEIIKELQKGDLMIPQEVYKKMVFDIYNSNHNSNKRFDWKDWGNCPR